MYRWPVFTTVVLSLFSCFYQIKAQKCVSYPWIKEHATGEEGIQKLLAIEICFRMCKMHGISNSRKCECCVSSTNIGWFLYLYWTVFLFLFCFLCMMSVRIRPVGAESQLEHFYRLHCIILSWLNHQCTRCITQCLTLGQAFVHKPRSNLVINYRSWLK